MDIDRGLIAAMIRDGMTEYYNSGVRKDMVEGPAAIALNYVEEYFRQFGRMPSFETLTQQTGVEVNIGPREPVKFWANELRRRHLYNSLKLGLGDAADLLEKRDSDGALSHLESTIYKLRHDLPTTQRVMSFFENPEELFEDYERSKLGITGIPTPWPTMNTLTNGWQPEDLIIIAARMGQGKTWVLLNTCIWAWNEGYKVLVGSTEMSRMSLRKRVAALSTKTSYGRLRHGSLTTMDEERFKAKMHELKNDKRFLVMGDGFSVTVESVEAAIVQEKPDLVAVDGMYLLRSAQLPKGVGKFERVSAIVDLLKDVAKRNKVPLAATTQLNRAPRDFKGTKGSYEMDRLAFSDNIGMVADYVFFLNQSKEMREKKEMEIQTGKVREAETIDNILINWDFERQDFSQKNIDKEKENKKAQEKFEPPPQDVPW